MKHLHKLLIVALVLLAFASVQAQEATPEAPPLAINVTIEQPEAETPEVEPEVRTINTVRQWLEIAALALLVLALGVGVVFLGRFLRRVLPRESALALADSAEVAIDEFDEMADESAGWLDNFLFAVSEPALRRFVSQLRAEGEETAAASLEEAWRTKSGHELAPTGGSQPHR